MFVINITCKYSKKRGISGKVMKSSFLLRFLIEIVFLWKLLLALDDMCSICLKQIIVLHNNFMDAIFNVTYADKYQLKAINDTCIYKIISYILYYIRFCTK